jgi:UDPglucose 6-dehydrogenase
MNIAVIGTGYVGLVTGACFAEFGMNVTCVDNDAAKLEDLKAGKLPIFEPGLEEIVRRNRAAGRLHFTLDTEAAVKDSLVIFIAVPTPPQPDGSTDLSYVDTVARAIGTFLDGYKVVVTKSTVPVRTADRVRALIAEASAEAGRDDPSFSVCSNPEFLREGSAVEDFMRPDRVVIGADDQHAVAILRDLYKPLNLIEVPFVITSVPSAEMIKHASNAFLATKITFINEIANLCEKVGADVHDVARAMGLDGRIGRKFLHPGPGYGGSCFPKDTLSLVNFSAEFGVKQRVVSAVVEANAHQREHRRRAPVAGDRDHPHAAGAGRAHPQLRSPGHGHRGARAPGRGVLPRRLPRRGGRRCADSGHRMERVPRPGPAAHQGRAALAGDRRHAQHLRAPRAGEHGLPLRGRRTLTWRSAASGPS